MFAASYAKSISQYLTTTAGCCGEPLMQQLAPVLTWGKIFFVPVSNLTKDRVRIVASQDNTTVQTDGIFIYSSSGNNTINKGQYIELEALLTNNGCSIQADNPVGVCTYLTGRNYNGFMTSDPSQAWLPALEQMGKSAMIAPFIPTGNSNLTAHYALVVTPFATKEHTRVSVGGGAPVPLSDGTWYNNLTVTPPMSFYHMPLTNPDASYYFTNNAGLIIMGYGTGSAESYYYLAGSAMRELDAAFYANDVHFQDLKDTAFCAGNVNFRAEIEGELHTDQGRLKWFINGTEEILERDNLTWNKTFTSGEYEIRMWARFANNDTVSKTDTLNIKSCDYNAVFYANNVHYENLQDTTFCNKDVYFSAVIEGLHTDEGSLKWFIDNEEYLPARDQMQWNKPFETGMYAIEMRVRFENDETVSIPSTLKMDIFWVKIKNVRY